MAASSAPCATHDQVQPHLTNGAQVLAEATFVRGRVYDTWPRHLSRTALFATLQLYLNTPDLLVPLSEPA